MARRLACELVEQTGRKVHTDMEMWNEVRRKVLVEGASKRSMRREYRIGSETLAKILANSEPLGYRLRVSLGRSRCWVRSRV